ncbi:helix-turn-helix domain-containing protein [Microbacterium imperiale]|uniref:helix-turn-helix domain-containing protein n=1 Tax=Microbacterium imperiale TaxID=33884 RepID=UPI001AE46056|nr:helix-turn-helix domain-containing protein [Microbacterium imperiale]
MQIPEGWISIEQAAALLGVSANTVRRRIRDRLIVGRRFGPKLLRVDQSKLLASLTPYPRNPRSTP